MNTNGLSGPTPMSRPTPMNKRPEIKSQTELQNDYTSSVTENTTDNFKYSYEDNDSDILDFGGYTEDSSSTEPVKETVTPKKVYKDGEWERTISYSSDAIYTESKQKTNKERVLYLILDKHIDGALNFFRSYGVNVSRIFNDIKSAKAQILMQVEPTEIVIIDSGTGEFTSTAARKEIIDLIGLCDEENKAEIFYCDDLLKSEIQYNEVLKKSKVSVSWEKYKSLAMVLVYLLYEKKHTNFIKDSSYGKTSDIHTDLKATLQKNTDEVVDSNESPDTITINTTDLIVCIKDRSNGNTLLEGFNTILKS